MVTKEMQEALAEVKILLDNMEIEMVEAIPIEVRDFINNNMSTAGEFIYNSSKPLAKQELRPQTKGIISFLYKEYICDENEKQEFMEQYSKFVNDKEQEKVAFDAEVIFGKELTKELVQKQNMPLVKQTWYEKIKSILKSLYKQKKSKHLN